MFLAIEAGLTVLALALALTAPELGSRWFGAIERSFARLARRRGLSVIVVGLTALALRGALLPILPIPVPGISDEYGYLLLSDTFAHGRLTNPTNPMWVHFETFQVMWQPTYTAKYWPAQGLIMAFGQALLGHPFWGVWLSVGLMCAAITWMLQSWVEEEWALLGGSLAVIRFGVFGYWDSSYFGGAVAAIGGALVLGALPRLKQERPVRHALLMGLGFAILANSRPYEGLFFGIPVALAMLAWLWRMKRPDLRSALKRVMAPLLGVLALTLIAMGYYFWRTTGNPLSPPYTVCEQQYDPVPAFPWQALRPVPVYRHAFIRDNILKTWVMPRYQQMQTLGGYASVEMANAFFFWAFYLGPLLTLPLLIALLLAPRGFSWKDFNPGTRFLLVICGATLIGEMLPIWYVAHYSAPITCAALGLVLIAMRSVRHWQVRGGPAGVFITRSVPFFCLLLAALLTGMDSLGWSANVTRPSSGALTWCTLTSSDKARAAMLEKLRQYPGRQLVFVRHDQASDNAPFEQVYNRADLDSAKVIWADDMGPAENEDLIRYFKGCHPWLLYPDSNTPKLVPYTVTGDQTSTTETRKGPAKNHELIDYYKDRRVWLLYADDQPPRLVPYSKAVEGAPLTGSQKAP